MVDVKRITPVEALLKSGSRLSDNDFIASACCSCVIFMLEAESNETVHPGIETSSSSSWYSFTNAANRSDIFDSRTLVLQPSATR